MSGFFRYNDDDTVDPYATPDVYYGPENINSGGRNSPIHRIRALSLSSRINLDDFKGPTGYAIKRRGSEDDSITSSKGTRKLLIEDVDEMLEKLLKNEDTDNNFQITIEDKGPKVLKIGTANSEGYKFVNIRGTYMLSNLLQELTIAKKFGRKQIVLDEARLNENPVDRLRRLIETEFWKSLTRRIDETSIREIAYDDKFVASKAKIPRIYVPYNCQDQYEYYIEVSKNNPSLLLDVEYLPKDITPEYVESLNDVPGLLTLAMQKHTDPVEGKETMIGWKYAVPGGRFNELYGWDSYFMTLGLLENNKVDVARGMVENFIFEIEHYGKILNANRSYYLCRSQPPFLTDMALKVFHKIGEDANPDAIDFLRRAFDAAIKEYKSVWTISPRYDAETGLSCYHPNGLGIPPETESNHFDSILLPYALKHNVSIEELKVLYNEQKIKEPELDEFFLHDRGVRESGHDTTYRFENVCAYLATIDLNSLLYKYETDISFVIKKYFGDSHVDYEGVVTTSQDWTLAAEERSKRINKYLWNEEEGMYFDYNVKTKQRSTYESATTFWPLWAKLCTPDQAESLVTKALPKFEMFGGLVSTTEKSRGEISAIRLVRQWDYPFGWAPHQILAWEGFKNYSYNKVARRLAYRWLYIITKVFVDYNGAVVEKYDVTSEIDPHKVEAEYGNQGSDFKGVATEGFGWVNASYILGLKCMTRHAKRALDSCISPTSFFSHLSSTERASFNV
ncbi:alpha,alpha-trehalase SCDLUD_002536 [Saccharomycodes ludwigii]|uniref:alpha,alpha-trehalase n=1 Tax=Saccharomycodes ludwigii TaxID=36035 RepID=UPI001E8218AF|nr:hypothetical protein SCDLUD_002536 [Saccharomycodes ludwigii]KAH3901062.1 hypothetical protein SCDLUD_002536 [Saccharomycodes ludwigii]